MLRQSSDKTQVKNEELSVRIAILVWAITYQQIVDRLSGDIRCLRWSGHVVGWGNNSCCWGNRGKFGEVLV